MCAFVWPRRCGRCLMGASVCEPIRYIDRRTVVLVARVVVERVRGWGWGGAADTYLRRAVCNACLCVKPYFMASVGGTSARLYRSPDPLRTRLFACAVQTPGCGEVQPALQWLD